MTPEQRQELERSLRFAVKDPAILARLLRRLEKSDDDSILRLAERFGADWITDAEVVAPIDDVTLRPGPVIDSGGRIELGSWRDRISNFASILVAPLGQSVVLMGAPDRFGEYRVPGGDEANAANVANVGVTLHATVLSDQRLLAVDLIESTTRSFTVVAVLGDVASEPFIVGLSECHGEVSWAHSELPEALLVEALLVEVGDAEPV